MNQEIKQLYVFGYGLPLLISFLFGMHAVKAMGFSFFVFTIILFSGFAFVMWLTTMLTKIQPSYNTWILTPLALATYYRYDHGSLGFVSGAVVLFVIGVLVATIVNVNSIKPIYDRWMKVAHFIGMAITTVMLSVLYYLVFTPIGLLYRVMGEDPLDRKIDKNVTSYWKIRKEKEFNPAHYERQF